MYSKFIDHMAVAYAMFQHKDISAANKAIQAAFKSPDAAKSLSAILTVNSAEFKRVTASDVGVETLDIGDDLRVEPTVDRVNCSEDEDEDDVIKDEDLEAPIAASVRRLQASAARERLTATAKPNDLKARYFAALSKSK